MDIWIKDLLNGLDRKKVDIDFSDHASKDKNLTYDDLDLVPLTVRIGKVELSKSTEEKRRICFKNYFKKKGKTYFVVVECYPISMKIVTIIKKEGKY